MKSSDLTRTDVLTSLSNRQQEKQAIWDKIHGGHRLPDHLTRSKDGLAIYAKPGYDMQGNKVSVNHHIQNAKAPDVKAGDHPSVQAAKNAGGSGKGNPYHDPKTGEFTSK